MDGIKFVAAENVVAQPTVSLRWRNGVLEQAWTIERRSGAIVQGRDVEWRPVPTHVETEGG